MWAGRGDKLEFWPGCLLPCNKTGTVRARRRHCLKCPAVGDSPHLHSKRTTFFTFATPTITSTYFVLHLLGNDLALFTLKLRSAVAAEVHQTEHFRLTQH